MKLISDTMGKFSVWRSPIQVASYAVAPDGGEVTVAQAAATTQAALNSLFDDDDEDDFDAARKRRLLLKKKQAAERQAAMAAEAKPFSLAPKAHADDDGDNGVVVCCSHCNTSAAIIFVSELRAQG